MPVVAKNAPRIYWNWLRFSYAVHLCTAIFRQSKPLCDLRIKIALFLPLAFQDFRSRIYIVTPCIYPNLLTILQS